MLAVRHDLNGLLLAAALGVAVLAGRLPALAQAPVAPAPQPAAASAEEPREEVVIRATREVDEAVTAKVVQVLEEDPYIFVGHISVATENGTVTLRGVVEDLSDMRRALMLARQVAGGRRIVNRIEFIPADDDHD